nr:hypothetical protein Iba_chr02cCG16560 [Ipomoea batatas]GMC65695.1 hypothetical protein Iba_chr02dCG16540 [Ipomoea batatas]GMC79170.1 hypothetical protein Iba_chr04aCG8480 [Ipomoea batatas]GMC84146.1 hypothetical protein Iba_chr04cCG8820 [Ipomoea batatas]GMD53019.1 hypothetical protein Iba_chr11bCG17150 [Ipomoea batatas]
MKVNQEKDGEDAYTAIRRRPAGAMEALGCGIGGSCRLGCRPVEAAGRWRLGCRDVEAASGWGDGGAGQPGLRDWRRLPAGLSSDGGGWAVAHWRLGCRAVEAAGPSSGGGRGVVARRSSTVVRRD